MFVEGDFKDKINVEYFKARDNHPTPSVLQEEICQALIGAFKKEKT